LPDKAPSDWDSAGGCDRRGARSEGRRSRAVPLLRLVARRRPRLAAGAALEAAQASL